MFFKKKIRSLFLKKNIYWKGKTLALDTVDFLVSQVSSILIGNYSELNGLYLLDIADSTSKKVFIQIMHPYYVKNKKTEFKLGIYAPVKFDKPLKKDSKSKKQAMLVFGFNEVHAEEELLCFYKTYEVSEKELFKKELKIILIEIYNIKLEDSFLLSFQM